MKRTLIKKAQFLNGTINDIYIENEKIIAIAPSIEKEVNKTIFAPKNSYISAGWIDIHVHCFEKFELYADDADKIGYTKGVTSVVDAGTSGADNMSEFYAVAKTKKTHVYALMNISRTGIYAQHELANMDLIDSKAFIETYKKFGNFIIGAKARMSASVVGNNNLQPLIKGKKIAKENNLPLMVHIGSNPPSLAKILEQLAPNDIVTHIFNPKPNGIIDIDKKVKQIVFDAHERGILFDIGHGKDSFSFETAKLALDQGLKFDTISSDIYVRNRLDGPVYDLATTMSKFLVLGVPLIDIINAVTIKAANSLNLTNIGEIAIGKRADFTFFKLQAGEKKLVDSTGTWQTIQEYIQPTHVFLRDEFINLEEI